MRNHITHFRLAALIATALVALAPSAFAQNDQSHFECTRAEPSAPILVPSKSQARSTFVLSRDKDAANSVVALETWKLDDSTNVRVEQSGCEDYAEIYTFVISGDTHDVSDRAYWFNKGARLLQLLPVKGESRRQIAEMVKSLNAMARRPNAFPDGRYELVPDYESVGVTVESVGAKKKITIDYVIAL